MIWKENQLGERKKRKSASYCNFFSQIVFLTVSAERLNWLINFELVEIEQVTKINVKFFHEVVTLVAKLRTTLCSH